MLILNQKFTFEYCLYEKFVEFRFKEKYQILL